MTGNASATVDRPARPEDEKSSFGGNLTYGLQHILTMYGGVIAPPLIIGGAAGLSPRTRDCSSRPRCSSAAWPPCCRPSACPTSAIPDRPIVALPPLLHFGAPQLQIPAIVSLTMVILVIVSETTADILAIGEIVDTPVDSRRVGDGLRADMASTTMPALLGAFPWSAFAQNVGLVALTKIQSCFVVVFGGGILVVLGLLPVAGRVVAAIPMPVLGGAGIVLFCSVAASGIQTLSTVSDHDNLNLVLLAVAIGFGAGPARGAH